MTPSTLAALHDAYASDYDAQVQAYDCYIADALFGLAYDLTLPGQSLLDLGIGSGLAAALFARAGLRISGMDFSPAMLDLCRAKGVAHELVQHDLQQLPWPIPSQAFDHAVCCGVLHFIAELRPLLAETQRLLKPGGSFAFTTRQPEAAPPEGQRFTRHLSGDFEIFSHDPAAVRAMLEEQGFTCLKSLRCFVGDEIQCLWAARRA